MKILFNCPVNYDASSFYRGYGPINHFKRHYPEYTFIDMTEIKSGLEWNILNDIDLIYLQRPATQNEVTVMRLAKKCKVPVWIDYDDNYTNIPKENPRSGIYTPDRVEAVRSAIRLADVISVSTLKLRNDLVSTLAVPLEKLHVIPNAVDEGIFDTSPVLKSNSVIMWRGGDTHEENLKPYYNKLSLLYYNFPESEWVFVGYPPKDFLSRIDNTRVKLYDWTDIFSYFNLLYELHPKLTLVPWAKDDFTACRSNSSWLESTLVGSVTLFPKWSTEFVDGMAGYNDPESFYATAKTLLSIDLTPYIETSIKTLKHFTLDRVNMLRKHLIDSLVSRQRLFTLSDTPKTSPLTPYGEFCFAVEAGLNQENDNYMKEVVATGKYLLDKINPLSIVEFGCGSGALLEYFLDHRLPQVIGVDGNTLFKDYFVERNPYYEACFKVDYPLIELDGVFDLGIAIECFHKIPMESLIPYVADLSSHFKYFYFSSTPFHTHERFDIEHGNINIHPEVFWVNMFLKTGWVVVESPQKMRPWDYLFKSTVV